MLVPIVGTVTSKTILIYLTIREALLIFHQQGFQELMGGAKAGVSRINGWCKTKQHFTSQSTEKFNII